MATETVETTGQAVESSAAEEQTVLASFAQEAMKLGVETEAPTVAGDEAGGSEQDGAASGGEPGGESTPDEGSKAPSEAGGFTPTADQVRAAKHVGYSDESISALGESDFRTIELASKTISRKETAWGREKQEIVSSTAKGGDKPPDKPVRESVSDDPLTGLEPMSDEDSFEDIARKYNTLLDRFGGYVKAVDERLGGMAEYSERSIQQETAREVDTFFSGMAKDDAQSVELFGKGAMSALHPDSPERELRRKVARYAGVLMEQHESDGEETPLSQCLAEALRIVAPQYQAAPKKGAKPKPPTTARPGGGTVAKPDADSEKAQLDALRSGAATLGVKME